MTAQLVEQGDVRGVDGEVLGLDSGKIAFLGLCPPMGRHSILPLTEENPQIPCPEYTQLTGNAAPLSFFDLVSGCGGGGG